LVLVEVNARRKQFARGFGVPRVTPGPQHVHNPRLVLGHWRLFEIISPSLTGIRRPINLWSQGLMPRFSAGSWPCSVQKRKDWRRRPGPHHRNPRRSASCGSETFHGLKTRTAIAIHPSRKAPAFGEPPRGTVLRTRWKAMTPLLWGPDQGLLQTWKRFCEVWQF